MLFLNTSLNLTKFRYLNIYNPDTQYVWIAFNDNKSIVYSDGKKIVYGE